MTIIQAVVLGIVQGLTEFIPVSSTAHLILVQRLLGWNFGQELDFAFNVLVQLGTTVAVILYFWQELWHIVRAFVSGLLQRKPLQTHEERLGWLIVLATVPALVIGLLFKKYFEALHERPELVAAVLIVASALLLLGETMGRRSRRLTAVTWLDALIVGCAQAVALVPGVSRSAATISAALARDLERPAAARLSFLMSVPVLLGASTLAFRDLLKIPNFVAVLPPILIGFMAAAIVGFMSIHWLLSYLAKRPLNVFAWYRVAAGVFFLAVVFLRA